MPLAFICSVAAHGLLFALVEVTRSEGPLRTASPSVDSWAAQGVEVGTVIDPPVPAPLAPARAPVAAAPPQHQSARAHSPPVDERDSRTVPRRPAGPVQQDPPNPGAAPEPGPTSPESPAVTEADSGPEPAAGSFGALGLPPGVRHLAKAFTRALPAGAYTDGDWSTLPLGKVGQVNLSLEVDAEGKLGQFEFDARDLPGVIERMLRRVALLLRSGRFSISPQTLGAGQEQLDLEIEISERLVTPNEFASPQDLFAQRFESPTADRPGFAEFTLNSGRLVRVVVRLAKHPN